MTKCSHILLASLILAVAHGAALSQAYPQRPVKFILGGAPGSVPDTLARPVAERLSASLGEPVVIDNRPGAAGSIAMQALVRSAPDGHTIALATMSQAVFNSYLFSKLPYDPQRDLEPVALLVTGAMALAAHPSFPASSMQELVRTAKAQPGKLFVAMPQAGSPPHVIALLLARAAGVEFTMVPHKSATEAMTIVLSGQVPLFIDAPTIISPQVRAGKLKALVVTGPEREAALPGVPTALESGLAGVQGEAWIGIVAPAGTSPAIVQRLNRELRAALETPEMRELMARFSFRPLYATPQEFRKLIADEHATWGTLIRDANLKLD
jgi:tripartite-type tricarboxylate transporter receptor subunit TctC